MTYQDRLDWACLWLELAIGGEPVHLISCDYKDEVELHFGIDKMITVSGIEICTSSKLRLKELIAEKLKALDIE